jgi:hypothetical protein
VWYTHSTVTGKQTQLGLEDKRKQAIQEAKRRLAEEGENAVEADDDGKFLNYHPPDLLANECQTLTRIMLSCFQLSLLLRPSSWKSKKSRLTLRKNRLTGSIRMANAAGHLTEIARTLSRARKRMSW